MFNLLHPLPSMIVPAPPASSREKIEENLRKLKNQNENNKDQNKFE
jgi:hypothetical protein